MTETVRPRAILVAVRLPDMDPTAADASLDELSRLVTTLGYDVVERVLQSRSSLAPAAVLGEGKLQALAKLTGGSGRTGPTIPGARHKTEPEAQLDDDAAEHEAGGDETPHGPEKPNIALVAVDHDISPSQLRNLER